MLTAQVRVLEAGCNIVNFYLLPTVLFFGVTILVASNYASVRMVQVIPMPWYVCHFLSHGQYRHSNSVSM